MTTRSGFSDGRATKLVAEELGGKDYISLNLYELATGPRLYPCEMPSAKVIAFVRAYTLIRPVRMTGDINLPLILIAALVAAGSPGPATLAIAGASMASGRKTGLALAAGVTTGSFIWSVSAAFGLSAIMAANVWVFEITRYVAAAYLLWLASKAARSAWAGSTVETKPQRIITPKHAYAKGPGIASYQPKGRALFGALYAIGMPPEADYQALVIVILAVGIQSAVIFHLYAVLFSSKAMTAAYSGAKRWFEGFFALAFGAIAYKVLTTQTQ